MKKNLDLDAQAAKLGIDLSKIDFDSVLLPPGENFGIESDDEDVYEEEVIEFEKGIGNNIIVDKLPIVGMDKFKKLEGVIRNLYKQLGVIMEDGFKMPNDPQTNKTFGYCFIAFNTPQEAEFAKEKTNGYKLSKSHILCVNTFDEFDKFMNVKETWEPPQIKPYTPKENLQKWLTDEKARDQFAIRYGPDTEVLWNDVRQSKSESVHKLENWTSGFVKWSPFGTYLVILHELGVAVCGGANSFKPLMHLKHPMVEFVDISPGENYLVTYSSQKPINPQDVKQIVVKIFDLRSGRLMREFKGSADEFSVEESGVSWPIFRWIGGQDDKYFAKLKKNTISVYETETFTLIDKKSMKVDNVADISPSPSDSILAMFVPEQSDGNQPARVALVQLPSKLELRQKNLFSVSNCKMYWQSNGDYLAVKVDRYTKTKKSTYSGIELFRVKEKDIPIEVVELENKKDKIIGFEWEPHGHRFALIHGDQPNPDVSFYSMRNGRVSKLITLKTKQVNALFWSPNGKHIILAELKAYNGKLEFYNVDELVTMATIDHSMATNIEWDPSGRYVASVVTSVHQMETGFTILYFNGKLIYQTPKDHFIQFAWRPRQASLLSEEKEEEIEKNLKKYSKKYEEEDEDLSMLLSEQEREKRRILKKEWEKWMNKWKMFKEEERLQRQNLRNGEVSDQEEEFEAVYFQEQEVVQVKEEVVVN